jgi:hypothetical protein
VTNATPARATALAQARKSLVDRYAVILTLNSQQQSNMAYCPSTARMFGIRSPKLYWLVMLRARSSGRGVPKLGAAGVADCGEAVRTPRQASGSLKVRLTMQGALGRAGQVVSYADEETQAALAAGTIDAGIHFVWHLVDYTLLQISSKFWRAQLLAVRADHKWNK